MQCDIRCRLLYNISLHVQGIQKYSDLCGISALTRVMTPIMLIFVPLYVPLFDPNYHKKSLFSLLGSCTESQWAFNLPSTYLANTLCFAQLHKYIKE
jgi:hypothetical protein